QPRFRAGYDFLRLRADAQELDGELADWWEDFSLGDADEREALLQLAREAERHRRQPDAAAGGAPAKRRRRRRRSGGPRGGGGAGRHMRRAPTVRAYVGIGANLGDARAQVRDGIAALDELPSTRRVGCSSFYASTPVDAPGPDYVNAVVALDTALSAPALLHE